MAYALKPVVTVVRSRAPETSWAAAEALAGHVHQALVVGGLTDAPPHLESKKRAVAFAPQYVYYGTTAAEARRLHETGLDGSGSGSGLETSCSLTHALFQSMAMGKNRAGHDVTTSTSVAAVLVFVMPSDKDKDTAGSAGAATPSGRVQLVALSPDQCRASLLAAVFVETRTYTQ